MTQLAFWKTFITPNRYSHDQIPDLTGKVAIVTGANTGLGYATTVALAAHGAHVFLACRNKQRAEDAITRATAEIKETYPHASEPKLEFLELDLNDMTKSRQAAQEFLKKGLPLHILINNSGIMMCPFALSADGIETQFAVNHMG
jgi:NAD(P)-dependent dehydrogenase (short-subunit alcohol dehydrogenase family)